MAMVARNPVLWKWLIAPFVLATMLLALLGWGVLRWVDPLIDELVARLPSWLSVVAGALEGLLLLAVLAGAYFVFVAVVSLMCGPFNERLSEELEELVTGSQRKHGSLGGFLRDLALGVAHAVRRALSYLFAAVALFLIGVLIPGVGTGLALIGGMYVTARFAAYDAYDAVMARRGWSYNAKMEYLARYRARTLGLGGGVALLLVLPVLNLLALPFGAAGATLGFLELENKAAAPHKE
jgi:CysZ protein